MPASEIPASVTQSKFAPEARPATSITRDIPLALLDEPLDPMRHHIDDEYIIELGHDIRESGLLQNLCVVPTHNGERRFPNLVCNEWMDNHIARGGRFRIAAGHCRLLACRLVRYDPVRCEIFCDLALPEEQIMHAENAHRADPTDYDLAVLYAKWIKEPGMTEKELARRAGKSLPFIYDRAQLLEGYENVAMALHERKISYAVARRLNRWKEPEFVQHWLNMAVDQGATGKIVQGWIDERKSLLALAQPAGPAPPPGAAIHAPVFQKVACLVCDDTQSYNLTTALLCTACRARIEALKAQGEAAEAGPTP